MSDEPSQTPEPQRSQDTPERPISIPPASPSSQRPSDRPRMQPTCPNHPLYPSQAQQVPYQPASPQSPPPRASHNPLLADFWRDMSALKVSIVTVVSTLLLITVCVVPTLLAASVSNSSVRISIAIQPTATTIPTQLPQPTVHPHPTNTPKPAGPQPLSGATLGGTQDGFARKFGAATDRSGVPWYTATLPDGTTAGICYCTEHTGSDSNPHLAWFHIDASSDTTWSDQQGVTIAQEFFPPDAKHMRDFTDPQIGLIHVYLSADLAITFPAGEFKDSGTDQQLDPGTFSVACGQPSPSQCIFATGD